MQLTMRARTAQRVDRRDSNDSRWMRALLGTALLSSICVAIARGEEDAAESREPAEPTKQVAAAAEVETAKEAAASNDDVANTEARRQVPARLIGATTTVTEVASGLPFEARVDTGATSCSIHCEAVEIKNADKDPKENIGKPVRFLVKNEEGEAEWVESKIVDHVTVRTAAKNDERYMVRLKLRLEDVEKKVLVTLKDRQHMKYPLLIGRNFLRDDFLVNVSLDSENPGDEE